MYAAFGNEVSVYRESKGSWEPVITTAGPYLAAVFSQEINMMQPEMKCKPGHKGAAPPRRPAPRKPKR